MNLRACARAFIAISFFLAGLAETLGATGLVIMFSPDARWGPRTQTLALGGLLQMAAAVLLASGRKTRWALGFLLGYVLLGTVFGNLPHILDSDAGGSALAGLVANLAAIGGLLYWLQFEGTPGWRAFPLTDLTGEGLDPRGSLLHARCADNRPTSGTRQGSSG
ncbi:MAG: hypothetical protein HY858_13295 [Candidatus Solibacter usitatus]|nr:hypothetical protein [Candidatus Solibacter usitatus]